MKHEGISESKRYSKRLNSIDREDYTWRLETESPTSTLISLKKTSESGTVVVLVCK